MSKAVQLLDPVPLEDIEEGAPGKIASNEILFTEVLRLPPGQALPTVHEDVMAAKVYAAYINRPVSKPHRLGIMAQRRGRKVYLSRREESRREESVRQTASG